MAPARPMPQQSLLFLLGDSYFAPPIEPGSDGGDDSGGPEGGGPVDITRALIKVDRQKVGGPRLPN